MGHMVVVATMVVQWTKSEEEEGRVLNENAFYIKSSTLKEKKNIFDFSLSIESHFRLFVNSSSIHGFCN